MIGQTISHYKVIEKLGQGGMGVVYKALDTRLDRFVAVKILPAESVSDADRRRRFVQEAKTASALNHPNIVTVHDLDSSGDISFIVMEYVDGRTLDRLIGGRSIKLNEALGYAVQVADALSKAHSAGIIHRDLKPSNIMITGSGTAKILDFGLAKLTEHAEPDEQGVTVGNDSKSLTEEGTIVGTAAYMSPEQAEGKKIDARSDIFSFGSVLYEMLTGRRAFRGETRAATRASIINQEPKAPRDLVQDLPEEVERLILRCLRKDPRRRWQHMDDLATVLLDLKEDSDSGKLTPAAAVAPARSRHILWAAPFLALLLVLTALFIWQRGRQPAVEQVFAASRVTTDSGLTFNVAISPDGKLLAYASDRGGNGNLDIWVQQPAGREPIQRTHDEADDRQPCFSPDGTRIAFRSERDGGGIYVMDTLGGEERKIADRGLKPTFSPDGNWIVYHEMPGASLIRFNKMYLIPSQGGTPKPFEADFGVDYPPIWSPDGRYVLFSGMKENDPQSLDWWVAPVGGGPAVRTGAVSSLQVSWNPLLFPLAWSGSHLIFARGAVVEGVNLYRTTIPPENWRVSDRIQQLTRGTGICVDAAVADDGRVLFSNMSAAVDAWEIALDTRAGTTIGAPRQLTQDSSVKGWLSVSSDGTRLAYLAFAGFQATRRVEVRLRDTLSGRESAVQVGGTGIDVSPRLSRDGSKLAYGEQIEGKRISYVVSREAATGSQVCEGCRIYDFFADSNQVLVSEGSRRLVRQDLTGGNPRPVLDSESGSILDACLSDDNRWIAFLLAKPSGAAAIYLSPLRDTPATEREWVAVAEELSYLAAPRWSPDGNFLYFLSERDGHGCVWAQRLDAGSKKPTGAPFGVWHEHRPSHSKLTWPRGGRSIGIARGKLVFFQVENRSNIYMIQPDVK